MEKIKAMAEKDIISAIDSKRIGTFRKLTWINDEFVDDKSIITVTKTAVVRIGIQYDHMRQVIARKEAEDASFGATKVRRESSYARLLDEKGKFVEPRYIVRDRKTMSKKYLQVCVSNAIDIKTKTFSSTTTNVYKNGKLIEEQKIIDELLSKHPKKKSSSHNIDTWVLPINKIINII